MKLGITSAGAPSILLGAVGLMLIGCNQPAKQAGAVQTAEHHEPIRIPPTNAPVVVRGGSVEFRAPGWYSTGASELETDLSITSHNDTLSIGGVVVMGTARPVFAHSATNLTANWKVVLTMRNSGGLEDPLQELDLCSAQDCNTDPSQGLEQGTVYVQYKGDDRTSAFTDVGPFDNTDIQRFDLGHCAGHAPGRDTACNHIFRVRVIGVQQWDDTDNHFDFQCKAGQCDIGVGPQT
jgi:hypothetical protein